MNILNILFPPYCFNCETEWAYLCLSCKKHLQAHPEKCPICHRISPGRHVCLKCKQQHTDLQGIIVGFQYTWVLKNLIRKLKYWHVQNLANFLAERLQFSILIHPTLLNAIQEKRLIISFVPSHRRKKHMVKWYNQSQLLAKSLAELLDVPSKQLRKKIKHTSAQAKLSRRKRTYNLQNAFIHTREQITWDETILIVDDVTTTGSTIQELARIHKETYPDTTVWWCVLWRHGR